MTLNFYPDKNGVLMDRDQTEKFLKSNPAITTVSGGYGNLEFTRSDVSKGIALYTLSDMLGIDHAATMAIGDTENDLAIIGAAGIGIAMGNATDMVKEQADFVTLSNMEDGVAHALDTFIPAAAD